MTMMICRARWFSGAALVLLAGAVASCSEAVPPAAQGAFTLSFQGMGTGGKACKIAGHNSSVGHATPSLLDKLEEDTVAGARIYCSVTGEGAFDVEATITMAGHFLEIAAAGVKQSATSDAPATGSASFASPDTVVQYVSPTNAPCSFWFTKDQQIAAGRAWMELKCDQIAHAGTDSSCAISAGTVAIQNCEQ
jgi:hypothetical protein